MFVQPTERKFVMSMRNQKILSDDAIKDGKNACSQMIIGKNEVPKIFNMSKAIENYAASSSSEGFDTEMVGCIKKHASQLETKFSPSEQSNYSGRGNPT